jgi:hypothetical protein
VFGKDGSAPVDLATLGSNSFRVDGVDANDGSGSSVSGAGDADGDVLADLVVGAPGTAPGRSAQSRRPRAAPGVPTRPEPPHRGSVRECCTILRC